MLNTQDLSTSFACFAIPGESRIQSKDRRQSICRFSDGMRFVLGMPRHLWRTKLLFAQSTQAKPIEVFPYPCLLYIPDNDAGDYSDNDILIDYYNEDQDYTLQLPPSKLTPPSLTTSQQTTPATNTTSIQRLQSVVKKVNNTHGDFIKSLQAPTPIPASARSSSFHMINPSPCKQNLKPPPIYNDTYKMDEDDCKPSPVPDPVRTIHETTVASINIKAESELPKTHIIQYNPRLQCKSDVCDDAIDDPTEYDAHVYGNDNVNDCDDANASQPNNAHSTLYSSEPALGGSEPDDDGDNEPSLIDNGDSRLVRRRSSCDIMNSLMKKAEHYKLPVLIAHPSIVKKQQAYISFINKLKPTLQIMSELRDVLVDFPKLGQPQTPEANEALYELLITHVDQVLFTLLE
jgi:hypothetical protein